MSAYIQAAAQISIQKPLSDEWLTDPLVYEVPFRRAIEADYKPFIDPVSARRMGKILKRAIATAATVAGESGISSPDAIICGTGLGCIENTEKFLSAMVNEGESFLQPTHFINSTHNTISSHIAVYLKCNGYNSTYVHLGVSFECALLDAFMQFQLGRIRSALVGGHDEMTSDYFNMLDRIGFWEGKVASECAVSFMISDTATPASMARIREVILLHNPGKERIEEAINTTCKKLGIPRQEWVSPPSVKPVFGESFTEPAYELYAAAVRMKKNISPDNVLLINNHQDRETSLIFISKC